MSDIQEARPAEELRLRASFGPLLTGESSWAAKVLETIQATTYEELGCVGLQPDQSALYATIEIKQDTGYGGDLCSGAGNREYVRFFADWDGDGDFADPDEDLGVASVAVHDVPGTKPLHYTVAVTVPDHRKLCFLAGPVAVRAVLMYGAIPPAGNPSPPLHWGNIVDVHVQPLTRHLILLDLLEHAKVKLPTELAPLIDQQLAIGAPKAAVELPTLISSYGDKVPLHRTLAPQLGNTVGALAKNASLQTTLADQFSSVLTEKVIEGIDLSKVIGSYLALGGDTTYEQLHCVGLSQDLSAVVGTFTVKESSGYSGGLCSTGSLEYVAFWADWDDNGTFETYLGTAAVTVHDETAPADGISYAVFLPIDLAAQQRPCGASHTAKIRAVLSWATPPSTTNPSATPVWGNIVDAEVQLPVGQPVVGQVPFLSVVGSMAVIDIDSFGYANGVAVGPGFTAVNAPFAGSVSLAGHISNPPDLSAGVAPLRYGLRYRGESEPAAAFHEITNTFQVSLSTYTGGVFHEVDAMQSVDAAGLYSYREDLTSNGPSGDLTFVEGFLLGQWLPSALADGRYEVWMVAEIGGSLVDSNHVWVQLDNTPPTGHLAGTADHVFIDQGQTLTGDFDVFDAHLGSWSLGVIPAGFPDAPVPFAGTANVAPGTTFSLSTVSAVPGGYVLELSAVDRAIVNSGSIGQWFETALGFCVEQP
jgi:hypothetical protein